MTDIEQKALSLGGRLRIAAACPDANAPLFAEAADAIEQHEAFKRVVSDALVWYFGSKEGCVSDALRDFIIPAPKPDPLADAVESVLSGFEGRKHAESYANQIRAALEARGLEIREKNDG